MDIQKIRLLREKLRQLERETSSHFKPETGCCGLTLTQCHALLEVGYKGEISLVELAASIGLDASTLSRTIQGLVMLGLVNRLTNEKDRRCVAISLTEQGSRVFTEIEATFNDYFGRVLELVPVEKRETMIDSIGAFSDVVRKLNESSGCCRDAGEPGEK
ncbi:MAG TPA: MarR family transcriptional regulator [Candidatus Desulfaltia sp.]|nr:MarR family transcriptional regulator [Candidatus Desulfaltia sp.]